MNIRAAKSAEAIESSVHIYSEIKELESLNLSKGELAYVEDSAKDEAWKISKINRFPAFLYLVKVSSKKLAKEQFQEKLRMEGVKCFKMLASQKAKAVTVSSLSADENAYYLAEGLALGA